MSLKVARMDRKMQSPNSANRATVSSLQKKQATSVFSLHGTIKFRQPSLRNGVESAFI